MSSSRIRWVSTVTEIYFLSDQRYRQRSTDAGEAIRSASGFVLVG